MQIAAGNWQITKSLQIEAGNLQKEQSNMQIAAGNWQIVKEFANRSRQLANRTIKPANSRWKPAKRAIKFTNSSWKLANKQRTCK
ncbi:hypothetical protein [Cytobacillus firmus]|uniref:hypothetical protein n=1 Tax=Cytobacillus firmus TaxID=1399 RepID=UPI00203A8136|nr:hypothetical protein [Cytobacillus firmus]